MDVLTARAAMWSSIRNGTLTRIAHPAEWHSILEVDDDRVETIDTDTGDMRPVAVVQSVEQRRDK